MKKTLLLLFVLIILNNVFAQFKQGTLIDDAKYHKRIKNYSKSFELFKEALSKPSNVSDDYYYAVKVALLNKDEDFAFKWLNDYTKIDSYRSIDEIKADSSLFKLHNNQKWEEFLKELTKQNSYREQKYNQVLKKELDQIYFDDQDIRIKYVNEMENPNTDTSKLDSMMKIMIKVDSINLRKITTILDKYGWLKSSEVGEKANTSIFGVIQHADLKTQQKYRPLLEKAFNEGNLPRNYYAQFEDRLKYRETKEQIYGTQYGTKPNSKEIFILPLIDPDNVDKRRLAIGLGHIDSYLQIFGMKWNLNDYKQNLQLYKVWSLRIE
jgi:hypothetical protein